MTKILAIEGEQPIRWEDGPYGDPCPYCDERTPTMGHITEHQRYHCNVVLKRNGGGLRHDFDTLKITIDATEYPGSVTHTYKQLYLTDLFVEDATFYDVMRVVTKAVEDVLRKRLINHD